MDRPRRVGNFTQWSDRIYDEDMDVLLNQLETPLLNEDKHELCDNVNRSMQKKANAGDGAHSVCFKDKEILKLIEVSLDERGYSRLFADSCFKILKDDLEILLQTATEQATLQACGKLMQKTFEINISYEDGKVFSNRHIKCVVGKLVPKLLAMKNRKLLNEETFDEREEITESDRHIVQYLGGSLIHCIKKKPGITADERNWCATLQLPHSQLPDIFAKRDRDDKLITTKPEFVNLLLELEHKYRTMRSTEKVPEDEIMSKIEVHKFMDQVNDKCLMLMIRRYMRMRSYFHA